MEEGFLSHIKSEKLKAALEDAKNQGVLIYQGNRLATPEEIACVQWVNEEANYSPEFIVKNELGDLKEIWFGEKMNFILAE